MVGCSGGGEATAANATLATAPCAARPRCPDAAGERTAAAEGRLHRAPPGGGLALGLGERSRASSLLLFSTWDGGQHNNAGAPRDSKARTHSRDVAFALQQSADRAA